MASRVSSIVPIVSKFSAIALNLIKLVAKSVLICPRLGVERNLASLPFISAICILNSPAVIFPSLNLSCRACLSFSACSMSPSTLALPV